MFNKKKINNILVLFNYFKILKGREVCFKLLFKYYLLTNKLNGVFLKRYYYYFLPYKKPWKNTKKYVSFFRYSVSTTSYIKKRIFKYKPYFFFIRFFWTDYWKERFKSDKKLRFFWISRINIFNKSYLRKYLFYLNQFNGKSFNWRYINIC